MFQSRIDEDSSNTAHPSAFYFRIRLLGPALGLATLASVVTMLLIFFDRPNAAPNTVGLLIVRLFPIPIAALFTGALAILCPVRVTSRGIKHPAWPLVIREMPWHEMHLVQYVNLLGFRFVAIYRQGAATGLWLPLFIKNRGQFCELVSIFAGEEHPLVVTLMKRCT
jgi:hypothetical protein